MRCPNVQTAERRTSAGCIQGRLWATLAVLTCLSCDTAAGDNSLLTAEIMQVCEDYRAARAEDEGTATNDLVQLFLRHKQTYESRLAQHKRTGNVRGMGISRTAIRKLDGLIEESSSGKPFTAVGRVRRELVKEFGAVEVEVRALEETQDARAKKIEDAYFAKFVGVYENADNASEEDLRRRFATAILSRARTPAAVTEASESKDAAVALPSPAPVASGEAAEWKTLGFWLAAVGCMDIFEVALTGAVTEVRSSGRHMMNNQPYRTLFRPIRQVTPAEGMQFRLKPVPEHGMAEIIEWPTERNEWQLTLRVPSVASANSPVGVEIQIGTDGDDTFPALIPANNRMKGDASTKADENKESGPIVVAISTTPPGAVVYVDGERTVRAGRTVRTPCELSLTEGRHSILLHRFGYRRIMIKNLGVTNDMQISRTLTADTAVLDTRVEVRANRKWTRSDVSVKKGERLILTASGRWHCGDRDQKIGPAGYPNNRAYFKYYAVAKQYPRQTAKGRYGELLMRIGREGAIRPVGASLNITVEEAGQLYFDINEETLASRRRDNGGILTVRIRKSP